jgi:hypothetical protein
LRATATPFATDVPEATILPAATRRPVSTILLQSTVLPEITQSPNATVVPQSTEHPLQTNVPQGQVETIDPDSMKGSDEGTKTTVWIGFVVAFMLGLVAFFVVLMITERTRIQRLKGRGREEDREDEEGYVETEEGFEYEGY